MVTLLIISDDFTGALDTGVKFAVRGAAVRVITDVEYDFFHVPEDVGVLVIDAESRHERPEEVYERIRGIAARARQAGIPYIYKKTDSALRGNIGCELEAVLEGTGSRLLHFLPAFPKMGRTTKNGIQYINGYPVNESVFGQDPFEPVCCASIPDLIALQSSVPVRVITDGEIAEEGNLPEIAVYDAETDEELSRLAQKLAANDQLGVLAGCAGMAETLPDLLHLTGSKPENPRLIDRFLIACGSVNPITKKQLDYAEQHGFERIWLTPQQKLEIGYFDREPGITELKEIEDRCRDAPLCILDTNDSDTGASTLRYAEENGISLEVLRVKISSTLGYLVKRLVQDCPESTMLITGGDSLLGFMSQIHVCEMTPICEMSPGTVLSQFSMNGRICEVISKSGGFGPEQLMTDLAKQIMGNSC